MKKPVFGMLAGMSASMIAAVVGTLAGCVFLTLKLESTRNLPKDFGRLDGDIQHSQSMISELVAAPVLPPLTQSWREVSATLQINGLALSPDDGSMANGSFSSYQGPLKHWSGSVSGDAKAVMAVINKIQKSEPVYLLDYSMADGIFKVYLAVVGI